MCALLLSGPAQLHSNATMSWRTTIYGNPDGNSTHWFDAMEFDRSRLRCSDEMHERVIPWMLSRTQYGTEPVGRRDRLHMCIEFLVNGNIFTRIAYTTLQLIWRSSTFGHT